MIKLWKDYLSVFTLKSRRGVDADPAMKGEGLQYLVYTVFWNEEDSAKKLNSLSLSFFLSPLSLSLSRSIVRSFVRNIRILIQFPCLRVKRGRQLHGGGGALPCLIPLYYNSAAQTNKSTDQFFNLISTELIYKKLDSDTCIFFFKSNVKGRRRKLSGVHECL